MVLAEGTKVRVKRLEPGLHHNGVYFNSRMADVCGRIVTIQERIGKCLYHICGFDYTWHENWFEVVSADEVGFEYRIGHKVIFDGYTDMPEELEPLVGRECTIISKRWDGYILEEERYSYPIEGRFFSKIDGYDYDKPIDKFNVGDFVIIRNVNPSHEYGKLCVDSDMSSYAGQITRITSVTNTVVDEGNRYHVGGNRWYWNSLMLERYIPAAIETGDIGFLNKNGNVLFAKVIDCNDEAACIVPIDAHKGLFDILLSDNASTDTAGRYIISRFEFIKFDPKKVRLTRDIFGIGKDGDIIDAHPLGGNAYVQVPPPVKGILFNEEYEEV